MEGHEDHTRFDPAAPGPGAPHVAGEPPSPEEPARPLTDDELVVAKHAARLAVEMLEPIIVSLADRLKSHAHDVEERLASLGGETDETRLDSLEARIKGFGQGGETLGDALAVADYAVACVRHVAGEIGRITGASISLPPAPLYVGPVEGSTVKGAELAASM